MSLNPSKPSYKLVNESSRGWSDVNDLIAELDDILKADQVDWNQAEATFQNMRLGFKNTEALLWYVDRSFVTKRLNGAPLPKLEENAPSITVVQPKGLQRLEELIAEQDQEAAAELLDVFQKDWRTIKMSIQELVISDRQVFEAMRHELLRIGFMEVTGFENPVFTDGLKEAKLAWQNLRLVTAEYLLEVVNPNLIAKTDEALKNGDMLLANQDFDSFDRLAFIREAVQPLYTSLVHIQMHLNIEGYYETLSFPIAYKDSATQLFETSFFDQYYFTTLTAGEDNATMKELGKYLFFDPILSANNQRSCASCHNPQRAFTDGDERSLAMDREGTVDRNSPGLINAVFAKSYFHDLRANPLEMQFEHVIFSEKEFNTSYAEITNRLSKSEEYKSLFKEAFEKEEAEISKYTITTALASYVASLQSFNSPVDQYLKREQDELKQEVKDGFNLFMGKATCGTCHFAPTFAGLVPPYFDESESEILGVPETAENKTLDPDLGRARAKFDFASEIYEHSFKTPTVRNVELTAPYMHNGVYQTLDQVIDFYNFGGGEGLGYSVPYQTLPPDSLHLTDYEIGALMAFMNALTDTTGLTAKPKTLPKIDDPKLNARVIGGEY